MRKVFPILVLLFIILFDTCANAQTNAIDSAKKVLQQQKEDTNEVHSLVSLSYLYIATHPDTGAIYAQQALDLAKRLNVEKSILEAEGVLSELLLVTGNYPLALDHGFKAVSLAKKLKSPALGYSYAMVAYSYYFLGEYATCLQYTHEVFKLSQGWEIPIAWRDLSVVYHRLNQPDSAMLYAKKAYEKLKGSEMEAKLYNVLGDAYAGKARYDSALLLFRNGVTASLKDPFVTYLIDNYIGIAGVY